MAVSRAGGKLEAALARFGLGGAVRGARAVDVGASTGGFTEALLAHGAASVLAVDVGHGQLHPTLRADARVTSLEGVDWRKLSLNEAEGPFDFFTVDVSFVAARNMLRAPGVPPAARAPQGVVLVKPQFELPDRQVKGGHVDDPNLRRAALEKVRGRAEALGFELAGEIDSPVRRRRRVDRDPGAPRLLGTADEPPRARASAARDERHPKRKARARAAAASLRWFAVVAPGLEEAAAREIARAAGRHRRCARRSAASSGARRRSAATARTSGCASPPACWRGSAPWRRASSAGCGGAPPASTGAPSSRPARRSPCGPAPAAAASTTRARIVETAALAIGDAVKGAHVAKDDEAADVSILVRGLEDASPSASTPPASGCIAAARASRSAPRRCARRWPPASWRWPAGTRASRWSIRCAAPGPSSSRRPRRRSTGRPGSTGRSGTGSRSTAGRCSRRARRRRRRRPCATRRAARIRAARPAADRRLRPRRARDRERAPQRRPRRGRRARSRSRAATSPTRARPAPAPGLVIANPALRPAPRRPARGGAHLPRARPRAARALPRLARRDRRSPAAARRRRRAASSICRSSHRLRNGGLPIVLCVGPIR